MLNKETIGELIQLSGLVVVGSGIGVELALRCDWCFVVITVGSILFAVGTKLKGR